MQPAATGFSASASTKNLRFSWISSLRFSFHLHFTVPACQTPRCQQEDLQKNVMTQTASSVPCAIEIPRVCAVIEYQKASSGSASASPRVHPVASANPGYPPHRCFRIHWRVLRNRCVRIRIYRIRLFRTR